MGLPEKPAWRNPGAFDMDLLRAYLMTEAETRFAMDDLIEIRPVIHWLLDDIVKHVGGRHTNECVARLMDLNPDVPRHESCICNFPPVFVFEFDQEPSWWID